MAAQPPLPSSGNVFLSVKDADKPQAVDLARQLISLGFKIYSTSGTASELSNNGVPVKRLFKLAEGRPNVVDLIKNGEMHIIINTPLGMIPRRDENIIRTEAIKHGICIITTMNGAQAAAQAIHSLGQMPLSVCPLQDYIKMIKS